MGKPTGKKKPQDAPKSSDGNSVKAGKTSDRASKTIDEDTAIFIKMSQELKEEGNKLLQKRDHEGAMSKYEKALTLIPKNHIDVAYLRTGIASCYMNMGLGEYPRAITECNLALEVSPRYSKALLKRARCYESLNRLDLAFRDSHLVLNMEPNNLLAKDILERVKIALVEKGVNVTEMESSLANVQPVGASRLRRVVKEKLNKNLKDKKIEQIEETNSEIGEQKNTEDNQVGEEEKVNLKHKEVVTKAVDKEEKLALEPIKEIEVITRTVKFVLGEDIRWAQLPLNCSIRLVRNIVHDRFPGITGALMKYKDQEGDFVTISTTEELRLAESSCDSHECLRLFVSEVSPDEEPPYGPLSIEELKVIRRPSGVVQIGNSDDTAESVAGMSCIEDWIIQFARLFKNHVGFDSDSYLELHERGMKLYSEAMEDTVAGDDAEEIFDIAEATFQEMAALALFNWGNVHMSTARKHVVFSEDSSRESILAQAKTAYEWAHKEYVNAGKRYEEAVKIKPDFYEGLLALGQQQFEQAKLCWYYAIGTETNLNSGPDQEILELYNNAEDSMERGMKMWEEIETQRLNGVSKFDKYKVQLQKMELDELLNEASCEEASDQAANMSSQIFLLWGTLLYERSVVEYKLGIPTWEECLEVSVEKFELAGASQTDVAVMLKNHCSNENALEGLGFKIDEIVQAWNEMYDARRWQIGVPSFRLEPLFRRRVPRLQYILETI